MYWLSTPNDDGNSAYMFKLTSSADELYFAERYLGLCLRPVMDRLPEEKRVTKGQVAGHDWVDLALPSGTRWATCNIDAAKPSQPGKHYAWGETVVKSSYTEANSKYNGKAGVKDILTIRSLESCCTTAIGTMLSWMTVGWLNLQASEMESIYTCRLRVSKMVQGLTIQVAVETIGPLPLRVQRVQVTTTMAQLLES